MTEPSQPVPTSDPISQTRARLLAPVAASGADPTGDLRLAMLAALEDEVVIVCRAIATLENPEAWARAEPVVRHAVEVLRGAVHAYRWLRRPNHVLIGKRPVEFLATPDGARWVDSVITQVDYGNFS